MGAPVYTLEERERGLAALVIAGSSVRASEVTGIPATTLKTWKTEHAERYEQLRHELEPQVAKTIAAEAETLAQRIAGLEHKTIDRIESTLDDLKPSEAAGALRNLSTSKALNLDKVSGPLRERPAYMPQGHSPEELVARMAKALGFTVGPTEDPPDATVVEDPTPPRPSLPSETVAPNA